MPSSPVGVHEQALQNPDRTVRLPVSDTESAA
jgi:hypothetical protein